MACDLIGLCAVSRSERAGAQTRGALERTTRLPRLLRHGYSAPIKSDRRSVSIGNS